MSFNTGLDYVGTGRDLSLHYICPYLKHRCDLHTATTNRQINIAYSPDIKLNTNTLHYGAIVRQSSAGLKG